MRWSETTGSRNVSDAIATWSSFTGVQFGKKAKGLWKEDTKYIEAEEKNREYRDASREREYKDSYSALELGGAVHNTENVSLHYILDEIPSRSSHHMQLLDPNNSWKNVKLICQDINQFFDKPHPGIVIPLTSSPWTLFRLPTQLVSSTLNTVSVFNCFHISVYLSVSNMSKRIEFMQSSPTASPARDFLSGGFLHVWHDAMYRDAINLPEVRLLKDAFDWIMTCAKAEESWAAGNKNFRLSRNYHISWIESAPPNEYIHVWMYLDLA